MFRVNGKPAIGLAIAMRDGGDILALGRNVKQAIDDSVADLPLGIEPTLVADQPVVVEHCHRRVHDVAVAGDRHHHGGELHQPRLPAGRRRGAVDSADARDRLPDHAVARHRPAAHFARRADHRPGPARRRRHDHDRRHDHRASPQGDSKEQAATFAYKTLALPMLTGSFVTAAGFVPIGFAQSSAGEYTFSIFAVVTHRADRVLVRRRAVCALAWRRGCSRSRIQLQPAKPKAWSCGSFRDPCRRDADALDHHRGDAGMFCRGSSGAALCAAAVLSGIRPSGARRRSDLAAKRLDLRQRSGSPPKLDAMLKDDPDVASWSTYVGRGAIRFYLPLDVQLANDFFSQAVVVAKDVAARDRLHARLEKALAEQLPSAVARVSPLELGPPVGWPVQYRVSGPDIAQVRAIALQLGQILGADANVEHVNFDWMEPARKVRINIDQDQARLLGLSSQALAEVLNTVMTGTPITQVRDDIYLINVVARAQTSSAVSLSTLRALQLPLPNGRTVPLSQVATFDFEQEYPLIWRRQRVPTLTVQADVASGSTPGSCGRLAGAGDREAQCEPAEGYHIEVGGTVEESAQSQASVFAMVPLMLFLMLVVPDGAVAQLQPPVPRPEHRSRWA